MTSRRRPLPSRRRRPAPSAVATGMCGSARAVLSTKMRSRYSSAARLWEIAAARRTSWSASVRSRTRNPHLRPRQHRRRPSRRRLPQRGHSRSRKCGGPLQSARSQLRAAPRRTQQPRHPRPQRRSPLRPWPQQPRRRRPTSPPAASRTGWPPDADAGVAAREPPGPARTPTLDHRRLSAPGWSYRRALTPHPPARSPHPSSLLPRRHQPRRTQPHQVRELGPALSQRPHRRGPWGLPTRQLSRSRRAQPGCSSAAAGSETSWPGSCSRTALRLVSRWGMATACSEQSVTS
jgi:hypothetical protein